MTEATSRKNYQKLKNWLKLFKNSWKLVKSWSKIADLSQNQNCLYVQKLSTGQKRTKFGINNFSIGWNVVQKKSQFLSILVKSEKNSRKL
jgi:hypothetical protein